MQDGRVRLHLGGGGAEVGRAQVALEGQAGGSSTPRGEVRVGAGDLRENGTKIFLEKSAVFSDDI